MEVTGLTGIKGEVLLAIGHLTTIGHITTSGLTVSEVQIIGTRTCAAINTLRKLLETIDSIGGNLRSDYEVYSGEV